MVKRQHPDADGVAPTAVGVAACASSCLDVLPAPAQQHHHHLLKKPAVLGSIENLPTTAAHQEASRLASSKKQCRLAVDQGPSSSITSLFARARAVLRQPVATNSQQQEEHSEAPPIGREREFDALHNAFEEFSSSGAGSSIYVSGLPGTGKSHTVRKSLCNFLSNVSTSATTSSNNSSSSVLVTWVNCMSVASAGEVYAQVAATATSGVSNGWEQQQQQQQQCSEDSDDLLPPFADDQQQQHTQQQHTQQQSLSYPALLDCLEQQQQSRAGLSGGRTAAAGSKKRYRAARSSSGSGGDSSTHSAACQHASSRHIIVLDEIDSLAKHSLADLVQLFKLPYEPRLGSSPSVFAASTHSAATAAVGAAAQSAPNTYSVLLVGIANSIDLTERALPELKLALVSPRLLTFSAYTAKQLGAILEGVVQQLPCKLFEPSALQLCCRSVGASSGDLRHALKACRAALDELEQHQQQQQQANGSSNGVSNISSSDTAAAPTAAAVPTVGPKHMSVALSRLAGVRSSQFGAQAASIIRSLPNQQQLLLYSLAVFCQQPAAQEEHIAGGGGNGSQGGGNSTPGGKAATSSLWKGAGSATMLGSSGAGGGGSPATTSVGGGGSGSALKKKKQMRKAAGDAPNPQGSVFVLAVSADAAYSQYTQVCKLLKLPASSKGDLLHMADLLAQMALLDIINTPTPASATAPSSAHGNSKAGAGGGGGGPLKGLRGGGSRLGGLGAGGGGRRGSLGGLGSRAGGGGGSGGVGGGGSLGGGGGSHPGSAAASGAVGQQGLGVKLCLRASSAEVFAALKHNPALRCLVDA